MEDLKKRIAGLTPQQYEKLKMRINEKKLDIPKTLINEEYNMFRSICSAEEKEYYPLSSAQKRLYILQQLEDTYTSYNIPGVIVIEGKVDREKLSKAFGTLVKRHESFRTSFNLVDYEPVQYIHKKIDFVMQYDEIMVGSNALLNEKIREMAKEFIKPFDLSKAPLLRAKLIDIGDKKHILMYDMHHIIADATSLAIFIKELLLIYEGKSIPSLNIQYKDFSEWQIKMLRTEQAKKQEDFWVKAFSGDIPVVDIPTDYERPLHQSFEGDVIKFDANAELEQEINKLSSDTGTTVFMVLLSALYILLASYSNQEDIIIGTLVSGRAHPDLKNIIGMFVNTLPLKNKVDLNMTYMDFLGQLKSTLLNAYENQDYQFDMLIEKLKVKRDLSRSPVIDVMFNMQNIGDFTLDVQDFKLSQFDSGNMISKFDLTLIAKKTENGIGFGMEYCTKLFNRSTIVRFSENYINILKSVIKNPQTKLYEIDVLSLEEKSKLLHEFNQTNTDYPRNLTIHQLFERQACIYPDKIALICRQKKITYGDLNLMSNKVAHMLRESGVKPGFIVGLMVSRSIEMLAGILGILKAGGAYLPIDPAYPAGRIKYMLENSGVKIVLTQASLKDRLESNAKIIDIMNIESYSDFYSNPEVTVCSDDLAYVIYTSGSTGNPKGVMIEHRAVGNFIKGMTEKINFNSGKTIAALTTVSFDIFVLETLLPLCVGMRVVIADENEQMDPRLISRLVIDNNIEMLQMTPSRLQLFMAHKESMAGLAKLKEIIVGGEAFPQKLFEELKKSTGARIYNVYGPTETTVWSTEKELTSSNKVTIGRPIANTNIYIMGKRHTLQPLGAYGELCIGGDGLARGYLNSAELTTEKFIKGIDGKRIYRTGDIARWLPNGEIEVLGRIDNQVKIRGYRIELGEIESCLLEFDEIAEAAVTEIVDKDNNKYLCAYLVTPNVIKVSEIRAELLRKLPDYMVPAYFVRLEKIPTTPNGKIDRKSFPDPEQSILCKSNYTPPQNEQEEKISKIWGEVLGIEAVGTTDSFFELGGDSIKALQISVRMNKLGLKTEIKDIFNNITVRDLSKAVLYVSHRMEGVPYNEESLAKEYAKANPADPDDYQLTRDEYDKICDMLVEPIEKIYPLSHMQEGMLFYSRLTLDMEAYVEQMCFTINGSLDLDIFQKSLDTLIQRYDILRTNFIYQNISKPMQIVYKGKKSSIHFIDISSKNENDKANFIEQYKNTDRTNSFDLTKDSLMRVSILCLNKQKHRVIWTRHHILMDGWCMNILINEFLQIYGSLLNNIPIKLNITYPYSRYIKWIVEQDKNAALNYWKDYLEGYNHSAVLPKKENSETVTQFEVNEYVSWLDNDIIKGLKKISVNAKITLNTVFQAIWGILLQWYNNTTDVVFGAVVSGRPSEVEGIESMLGLFVNTIPIRVKCDERSTFVGLAKQLQEQALASKRHEYISLADIQAATYLKNTLFENIVIFENYPEQEGNWTAIPEIGFKADEFEGFEKSSYFFNIIVQPGNRLMIKFGYNSLVYSQNCIMEISFRLERIIQQIIENPEIVIQELDIFTEVEKETGMKQYNEMLPKINKDNENVIVHFNFGK